MRDLLTQLSILSITLYLWICFAYIVACSRSGQRLWLVLMGALALLGLLMNFVFNVATGAYEELFAAAYILGWPSPIFWVSYPALLLTVLFKTTPIARAYGRVSDVLRLGLPRAGAAPPASGQLLRQAVALCLGSTLLLGIASAGSAELEPCSWPDIAIGDSGCLGELHFPDAVERSVLSPDGKLLAISRTDHALELWQVGRWEIQHHLDLPIAQAASVAFAPDHTLVATADDAEVRLWRTSDGGLARTLAIDAPSARIAGVAFSPDGQLVATHVDRGTDDHVIWLWRVVDGSLVQRLPASGQSLAFSPDGALFARQDLDGSIVLLRLDDGTEAQRIREPLGSSEALAFSPDGRLLANLSRGGRELSLWRVADAQLVWMITLYGVYTPKMVFSPDGSDLVLSGSRGGIETWSVANGRIQMEVGNDTLHVVDLVPLPDGALVVAWQGGGSVRLWRELRYPLPGR